MWRTKFVEEQSKTLCPFVMGRASSFASTASMGKGRASQKQPRSVKTNSKCNTELLHLPPCEWSERRARDFFAQCPGELQLPVLYDINEIVLRKHGLAKYLCVFENKSGELCEVWVSAAILAQYYRSRVSSLQVHFQSQLL